MLIQTSVVAALVLGCTIYAGWTLMPASARRLLAEQLLRLRWPSRVRALLHRHAQATSGCGCDGCDHGAKPRDPAQAQPIRLHRRTVR
jgi:hypothetical protein